MRSRSSFMFTLMAVASAIAAHLARGKSVVDAIQSAKAYLTEAIRHSLAIGHGQGPTDHFYFLER